jgi:anti-sigma factor (TIGR02949 family)
MTDDTGGRIRCEEALRRLGAYLDGELGPHDRTDVERHLDACRSCYSRAEFERRLQVQLATLGRREPAPEFRARLQGLVRRFTTGRDAAPQDE